MGSTLLVGQLLLFIHLLSTKVFAVDDARAIISCKQLARRSTHDLADARLADHIKLCLELDIDAHDMSTLERIVEIIPLSIRNAVFTEEVCILNTYSEEFLYTPVSGNKYDDEKRGVFTNIQKNLKHHRKGDWKIFARGKYFLIVGANNHEYLFGANNDFTEDESRRVFTWDPMHWDDINERQGEWELEADGDDVYIKNRQYKEYLYVVKDEIYDNERRTVATSHDFDFCRDNKQCIWKIVTC